jgi:hypothetical protein
MFYNRFGWSLTSIVWLSVLLPRRDGRWPMSDYRAVGIMMAALLFIKVNYFAVTVLVVALGWLSRPRKIRAAFEYAVVGSLVTVLFVWASGTSFLGYINDLRLGGQSQEWWKLASYLRPTWIDNRGAILLIAALLVIELSVSRSMRNVWPILLSVAGGMIIMQANSHAGIAPVFPVAVLILAELSRRASGRRFVVMGFRAACAVLAATILVPDALSTARAVRERVVRGASRGSYLYLPGVLSDMPLPFGPGETRNLAEIRHRLVGMNPAAGDLTPAECYVYYDDGLRLLKSYADTRRPILTMDLFNPWALMLMSNPPKGDWIAWDPGRNFSTSSHFSFAQISSDSAYVMVPRIAYYPPAAREKLAIYQGSLERDFRVLAKSDLWTLWERIAL